jgi:hypothetical protein
MAIGNFQRDASNGMRAMAAEEKRDARMAGLMLGCIVLFCA